MTELFVAAVLGFFLLSLLFVIRKQIAGTTLVGPHNWTILSVTALIAMCLTSGDTSRESSRDAIIYLVTISTCLPIVAVLGAKKPQNLPWQWIVGGLWVILAIPAFNAIIHGQPSFELGSIWGCLLIVLIILPVGNYCVTRYRFSALLIAIMQTLLFLDCGRLTIGDFAQGVFDRIPIRTTTLALMIALIGILLAYFATVRRRSRVSQPLGHVWHEFSQLYGILWSKRVADRVEHLCAQSHPSILLGQNGFTQRSDAQEFSDTLEHVPAEVEETLKHLLLRFVSRDWLEQRSNSVQSSSREPTA